MFQVIAVLAVIAAAWLVHEDQDGWAFVATTSRSPRASLSIFVDLYPNVMVSSTSPANDLTVHNTASGSYALKVMTVVAVVLFPVVLVYQAGRTTCSASGSAGRTSSRQSPARRTAFPPKPVTNPEVGPTTMSGH